LPEPILLEGGIGDIYLEPAPILLEDRVNPILLEGGGGPIWLEPAPILLEPLIAPFEQTYFVLNLVRLMGRRGA
jgi:hypothetical protein